jgi:hypothetical protein
VPAAAIVSVARVAIGDSFLDMSGHAGWPHGRRAGRSDEEG